MYICMYIYTCGTSPLDLKFSPGPRIVALVPVPLARHFEYGFTQELTCGASQLEPKVPPGPEES